MMVGCRLCISNSSGIGSLLIMADSVASFWWWERLSSSASLDMLEVMLLTSEVTAGSGECQGETWRHVAMSGIVLGISWCWELEMPTKHCLGMILLLSESLNTETVVLLSGLIMFMVGTMQRWSGNVVAWYGRISTAACLGAPDPAD